MKRTLLGALLFLILVGEPTVGAKSGLFTPGGLLVFGVLYISYFLLFDSIVRTYRPNNLQIVLINFALYSVLTTGLLHGELRDYVLHPHNDLITTLIRIQCSFFPLYAYALLNKLAPGTRSQLSLRASVLVFIASMLILSLSRHFGIVDVVNTFQVAPLLATIFTLSAAAALVLGLYIKAPAHAEATTGGFKAWSWIFLVVALVPLVSIFFIFVISMITVSLYFLARKSFRFSAVA